MKVKKTIDIDDLAKILGKDAYIWQKYGKERIYIKVHSSNDKMFLEQLTTGRWKLFLPSSWNTEQKTHTQKIWTKQLRTIISKYGYDNDNKKLIMILENNNIKYNNDRNNIIIEKLDINTIQKLPVLLQNVIVQKIDLSNNNLTKIPENLININCKELDLTNNKIEILPILNRNIEILKIDNIYIDNLIYLTSLRYLCINEIWYENNKIQEFIKKLNNDFAQNNDELIEFNY